MSAGERVKRNMSTNEQLTRYRFHFEKNEMMKYTGHLDLHRTLERTFRRSNIPLAYSQGFNPHAKITLALALPLGCTSADEIVDFWLDEPLEIDEVEKQLKKALPPGMTFLALEPISIQEPKPQNIVESAIFTITLKNEDPSLKEKIQTFMDSEEVLMEKKRKGKLKKINIRSLVEEMSVVKDGISLTMQLSALPSSTGRPDDVMLMMGYAINAYNFHREKIVL